MASYFSSLGGPETGNEDNLREMCESGEIGGWTVHKKAQPGDRLLFYVTAPTMAFVAIGTVISLPEDYASSYKDPFGDVSVDQMARNPVSRQQVMERFPQLGWMKQPRQSYQLPAEVAIWIIRSMNLDDASSEVHPLREACGGGFADFPDREEVERAAVAWVRDWLEAEGWTVGSREADRCGYDLHCTRGNQEQHVEVKGTSGTQQAFILTEKERQQAKTDEHFLLCMVTDVLSDKSGCYDYPGDELFEYFDLKPMQWMVKLKR